MDFVNPINLSRRESFQIKNKKEKNILKKNLGYVIFLKEK
jgi:hypothetical protein